MLFNKVILIMLLFVLTHEQITRIVRNNPFLSRKKRYLSFPKDSNFVITLSFIKALLMVQPRGWNLLGECDVPFALPADTRLFKKQPKILKLQRREIFRRLETAFFQQNFNGSACLNRMICEVCQYQHIEGKSLVKDLLTAIFMLPEIHSNPTCENYCMNSYFIHCEVSFFSFFINSLFSP